MRGTALAAGLLGVLLVSPVFATMPEKPLGRVSDFAGVLGEEDKTVISTLAERVEGDTGAQMAVVTVPSLDGLTVEEYATALFKKWGVGHKGKDDGVLLLVAPTERKVRIEVGYGLEGVLNDGQAGRILDEAVIPHFKAGDFPQGILAGSERIAAAITQDASLVQERTPKAAESEPMPLAGKIGLLAFLGLFVTLGGLAAGAGLRGNFFLTLWGALFGGIPTVMGTLVMGAFGFPKLVMLGYLLAMVVVGALFGAKAAKSIKVRGRIGGGGFSSGSGGSSSSSSGFGGGSSGGGGSSRSW